MKSQLPNLATLLCFNCIVTMYSLLEIPSPSSLFTFFASVSATVMFVRSIANDLLPPPLRTHLHAFLGRILRRCSDKLTLIIEDGGGFSNNKVYKAAEVYLSRKVGPEMDRIKIGKTPQETQLAYRFVEGQQLEDNYEDIKLHWRFNSRESNGANNSSRTEIRFFELSFKKEHMDRVISAYIPFIEGRFEFLRSQDRILKLYTLGEPFTGCLWNAINHNPPSTFDTLAMDPDLKQSIIEDLDRFVSRREFYRRVGRAWKRGYLLYGPPGTGKSSLIAAIANYLRFDVYDLQLGNLKKDSDLRRLLLDISSRSILVIEDIDCTINIPNRENAKSKGQHNKILEPKLTLSGLLNFIDGLWSSCGEERIIIFTTNHKEKLDPALLRSGRMDRHIHMTYLSFSGFQTLASNYLGINDHHHRLFKEIEQLMNNTNVTPARMAEELSRVEDPDAALQGVVNLLQRKNKEDEEIKNNLKENYGNSENEKILSVKKQKVTNLMSHFHWGGKCCIKQKIMLEGRQKAAG